MTVLDCQNTLPKFRFHNNEREPVDGGKIVLQQRVNRLFVWEATPQGCRYWQTLVASPSSSSLSSALSVGYGRGWMSVDALTPESGNLRSVDQRRTSRTVADIALSPSVQFPWPTRTHHSGDLRLPALLCLGNASRRPQLHLVPSLRVLRAVSHVGWILSDGGRYRDLWISSVSAGNTH